MMFRHCVGLLKSLGYAKYGKSICLSLLVFFYNYCDSNWWLFITSMLLFSLDKTNSKNILLLIDKDCNKSKQCNIG